MGGPAGRQPGLLLQLPCPPSSLLMPQVRSFFSSTAGRARPRSLPATSSSLPGDGMSRAPPAAHELQRTASRTHSRPEGGQGKGQGLEATLAELTRHVALLTEQNAEILRELRRMATSGEATERKRSVDEATECIYLSRCGERFHTSKECVRAFGGKEIRMLTRCQRCTRG